MKSIYEEIGCSSNALRSLCKELGCDGKIAPVSIIEKMNLDHDWLINQYINLRRPFLDIAMEIGVNPETLSKYYRKHKLPERDSDYLCEFYGVTEEWFVDQFLTYNKTTSCVAKEMGISKATVKKLKDRIVPNEKAIPLHIKHHIDLEWLQQERNKGVSYKKLAEQVGISRAILSQICRDNGILTDEEIKQDKLREEERTQRRRRLYLENKWKMDAVQKYSSPTPNQHSNNKIERRLEQVVPIADKYHIDKDELYNMREEQGMSTCQIGKIFGMCRATAELMCLELDYQQKPIDKAEKYGINHDWLYERRITQKRGFQDIANELGISYPLVKQLYLILFLDIDETDIFLSQHNLSRKELIRQCRTQGINKIAENMGEEKNYMRFILHLCQELEKESTLDEEWLIKEYSISNRAVREIASDVQLNEAYIYRQIKERKMRRGNIAERLGITREQLYQMIVEENLTFYEVSKVYNTTRDMIRAACVLLNVPRPMLSTGERNGVSYEEALTITQTPNLSHIDMSRKMGVSIATFYKIIDEYQINRPHNYLNESADEIIWQSFLDKYGINYVTHQFCLSDGGFSQEIDILIPEKNIGIEISPVYTHNSDVGPYYGGLQNQPKPSSYHQQKAMLAENIGVNLIHIFDWYEQSKIESLICSYLKLDATLSLDASNITTISRDEEKQFFSLFHLLGYSESDRCYALTNQKEIIAAMSFRQKQDTNNWELLRFAVKTGIEVIDSPYILFNHFIKNESPDSVESRCNYDVSNGELEESLSFQYIETTKPSHHWVLNDKSKKCIETQTQKISELRDKNYVRVYDCGEKIYIWRKE